MGRHPNEKKPSTKAWKSFRSRKPKKTSIWPPRQQAESRFAEPQSLVTSFRCAGMRVLNQSREGFLLADRHLLWPLVWALTVVNCDPQRVFEDSQLLPDGFTAGPFSRTFGGVADDASPVMVRSGPAK